MNRSSFLYLSQVILNKYFYFLIVKLIRQNLTADLQVLVVQANFAIVPNRFLNDSRPVQQRKRASSAPVQ